MADPRNNISLEDKHKKHEMIHLASGQNLRYPFGDVYHPTVVFACLCEGFCWRVFTRVPDFDAQPLANVEWLHTASHVAKSNNWGPNQEGQVESTPAVIDLGEHSRLFRMNTTNGYESPAWVGLSTTVFGHSHVAVPVGHKVLPSAGSALVGFYVFL